MTFRQEKAIHALLVCPTKREAAAQAGICEATLRAYFNDPEFVAAYRKAAAGLMDGATKRLQQSLTTAIDKLVEIVQDSSVNAAIQVTAARSLLEFGLRYTEFNDILVELQDAEDIECTTTG